jgi:hypothetical protein
MTQTLQVTCISKILRGDPHERIGYIGGTAWRFTEAQAINFIEGGMFDFFVNVAGRAVRLVVGRRAGEKYLKTADDAEAPVQLLTLPECQLSG